MDAFTNEGKPLPLPVFEHGALVGTDAPEAVKAGCRAWAESRGLPRDCVLSVLQYDALNRCHCFRYGILYLGVEADGHIHS